MIPIYEVAKIWKEQKFHYLLFKIYLNNCIRIILHYAR